MRTVCAGLGIVLLTVSGPLPSGPDAAPSGTLSIAPHVRVEIAVPSLGIPSGLYGPAQARELWSRIREREKPEFKSAQEIPLPNVTGKFKSYLVELRTASRIIWLRAILKKWGETWALQSVREVQRY